MTTPDDADLFEVLSAITITGPDAQTLLWISFKTDDPLGKVTDPITSDASSTPPAAIDAAPASSTHHLINQQPINPQPQGADQSSHDDNTNSSTRGHRNRQNLHRSIRRAHRATDFRRLPPVPISMRSTCRSVIALA